MPKTAEFYSKNEAVKPVDERVYHNNSACARGLDIPEKERRQGRGVSAEEVAAGVPGGEGISITPAYHLCEECVRLNGQGF